MSTTDAVNAARMRSLARLARATAHDLRGASNAISIHLELLAGTLDEPADSETRGRSARYLAVLREQNERLVRTANAFLDLTVLPGGSGEIDLAALVSEIGLAVHPLAIERRVHLEIGEMPAAQRLVPDQEDCRQRLLDAVIDVLAEAPPGATLRLVLRPGGRNACVQLENGSTGTVAVEVPLLPAGEELVGA